MNNRFRSWLRCPIAIQWRLLVYYSKRLLQLPLSSSDKQIIEAFGYCVSWGIIITSYDENGLWLNLSPKYKGSVYMRHRPTSDWDVFYQVFVKQEYQPVIDSLKGILKQNGPLKIMDAGANVGHTSVFIKSQWSDAEIVCVEPDAENFKILNRVMVQPEFDQVTALNAAVWYTNESVSINGHFRDGRSWAKSVSKDESNSSDLVEGFTVDTLMDMYGWDSIDLLKMDVEGAEAKVFGRDSNTGFLKKVRSIAIEIHDEFDCREAIENLLMQNGFELSHSGELTIGIKPQKTESA